MRTNKNLLKAILVLGLPLVLGMTPVNLKQGSSVKPNQTASNTSATTQLAEALIVHGLQSPTSALANPTNLPPASTQQSQLLALAADLRTARARIRSLQRMSPRQKAALARLEQQVGSNIEIRIRPDLGTPRMIVLPMPGKVVPNAVAAVPAPLLTAYNFLNANRELLLLTEPEQELHLMRQETDQLGHTHLRFSQAYLGMEVWAAELIVHLDPNGRVESLDGMFVPTPALVATTPILQANQALETALSAVPGPIQGQATLPQLIVYAPGQETVHLAWKVQIDEAADAKWLVIVDALSGAILKAFNQVPNGNVAGSGVDLLGANRPLNVWQKDNKYYLVDTSKPMFDPNSTPPGNPQGAILVVDANHQTMPGSGSLTCAQITSTSPSSGWMKDGVSGAFGLSQTYDYYRNRHGRNSIDGQGGNMLAIVRYGENYRNAFWNGQAMFFGDALPFAGALDVVGHELTHGVTSHTANLVYQDQSGALDEGFADIFGGMVQAWVQGTNNWFVGEDLGQMGRSMSDPGSLQFTSGRAFPAKMSEFVGPNDPALAGMPNNDNGGVHINSTIISHAYYLLSVGLPGALTPTNSASIFYRALTSHMVAQSEFLDCRLACVQSAKELFGDTSAQALKTAEAFDAVEIFDGATPTPPPSNPTVTNVDSALFVYYDSGEGAWYLARREEMLQDPPYGTPISVYPVSPSRPSVSGDGAYGAFVNSLNDMCLITTDTDGVIPETQLGYPGQIASVAMAPDGEHYAFVLQDMNGQRLNKILYIDTSGASSPRTIDLKAPSDAGPVNSIYYADTLCFTPDNRYIIFDALNLLQISGGSTNQVWSIYAYDLKSDRTLTMIAPVPGMDIGNPAVGRTGNDLLTFEVRNQQTEISTIIAENLRTGTNQVVGSVKTIIAWPCYNGDDTSIVYSQADTATQTGASLSRQHLGPDHVSPLGSATEWVDDGQCGFVYRRGTYTAPAEEKSADLTLAVSASASQLIVGSNVSFTLTVLNNGPDNVTGVKLVHNLPANMAFVSGEVSQGNSSHANGKVTCALGELAKGSRATATIVAQATAEGQARHTASVTGDQADPSPANNGAAVTVTVASGTNTAVLNLVATPIEGGTVSGNGTFIVGSQHQIAAVPNPGWVFRQWQDGSRDNPRTVVVVAGGSTYTALFETLPGPAGIPHVSLPCYLPDGRFQFTLTGAAGSNYQVRVSSDLMNWQVLKTVSLVVTTTNITEDKPLTQQRFYRARLMP